MGDPGGFKQEGQEVGGRTGSELNLGKGVLGSHGQDSVMAGGG